MKEVSKLQNCEEIPYIDLKDLDQYELDEVITAIEEICSQLSEKNYIIIRIHKSSE